MAGVRGLLERVKRLERRRESPQMAYLGSDEFEADIRDRIAEGKLDRRDWLGETGDGGILVCLKRWAREQPR